MRKYTTLKTLALVAGLAVAPMLASGAARAVDNMSSNDKVDLTSVRAKIKAKDYTAAIQELRDLAEDTQQADVYNLLGYTLRKTGDYTTSLSKEQLVVLVKLCPSGCEEREDLEKAIKAKGN
jgi:hypothetical protein